MEPIGIAIAPSIGSIGQTRKTPYWLPAGPGYTNNLIALFGISKRGESPSLPTWLKPVSEGGMLIPSSSIWNIISKIKSQPQATKTSPTYVTQPIAYATVTITSSVERTITSISQSPIKYYCHNNYDYYNY